MRRWNNQRLVSGNDERRTDDRIWVELTRSNFRALGQLECVLDVNAEIPDGAFDLGMPKKNLDRTQIPGRLVNDRCFGAPKLVRAVILGLKADPGHPLPDQSGVLPSAHVSHVVVPAWENEVVEGATTALKPSEQRLSGRFDQLELDGPFGFLLHDNSAIPYATAGDYVTDAYLDHVATAKLAVDGEVEKGPVAQSAMLVEPETDRPYLLRFERTLGAEQSAFVPGTKFMECGIHRRMPHRSSP